VACVQHLLPHFSRTCWLVTTAAVQVVSVGETVTKKSLRVVTVVSEEGGDSGEGVRRVVTVVRE